ncbi:MAG TPA: Fur family transcriptional regulator [Thermodesulfovibrionales bacterium]|nr:Fur family transcriptional regulator [Thermodesulfovibrionales bacterium]
MAARGIKDKLIETLRKNNLKLTRQRLEIIEVLAVDRSHPSAMEILAKVRKKVPKISASTVYYTLNLLKREGLIKELEFYDRENRYEGDITDHLNLVCTQCGKIEDFHGEIPFQAKHVERKTGFRIQQIRFEYYGLCRECQAKRR